MANTYNLLWRMRNEPPAAIADLIKQAIGGAFLTSQTHVVNEESLTLQWTKTATKQKYALTTDAGTQTVSHHNGITLNAIVDDIRHGEAYASLREMPGYFSNWQIMLYLSKM